MRMRFLSVLVLAGLPLLAGCAGSGPEAMTLTYENPLWPGYLADPFVLEGADVTIIFRLKQRGIDPSELS